MTDKELDKLFESKLQEREFEMNPENWAAMEAILNAKAKRGGAFYWRSVAAVFAFGILAALSLLIVDPDTPAEQNVAQEEQQFRNPQAPLEDPNSSKTEEKPAIKNEQNLYTPKESLISDAPAQTGRSREVTPPGSSQSTPPPAEGSTPASDYAGTSGKALATVPSDEESAGTPSVTANAFGTEAQNSSNEVLAFVIVDSKELATLETPVVELNPASVDPFIPEALSKFSARHEFFATGSSLLGNAFSSNSAGLGFSAGIGYRLRLDPQLSVEVSANYLQLNSVDLTDKRDSTFFNFGKEHIQINRQVNQLGYLQIPIALTYHLDSRHSVGMGGYTSLLLSVTEKLERTHEMAKRPTQHSTATNTGYHEDFRRFDYGFTANYFYRVTPALSFGVQVQKGFTDITHDVSEGFKPVHQNFNTQISVRYRFLSL